MKVGPLFHALKRLDWACPVLIHTGQHYDPLMSDVFFRDVGLPAPHFYLGVGSGTHAQTTAAVMVAYEKVCLESRPDLVIVVGDVDSTVAAALCAKKRGDRVAHLEAGLRSFDRSMPEELNRIVTDSISDVLWTPSEDADANLLREGVASERISRVGNIMIDAYEVLAPKIHLSTVTSDLRLVVGPFGVVTLHRPANVDRADTLASFMRELRRLSRDLPIVFPVHPRTRNMLNALERDVGGDDDRLRLLPPLGYIDFMKLVSDAAFVLTDSGGVQEETTYLGVPCLTARTSTERPITVTHGTNRLIRMDQIVQSAHDILSGPRGERPVIPLWDGRTAERVVASIAAQCT